MNIKKIGQIIDSKDHKSIEDIMLRGILGEAPPVSHKSEIHEI